MERHRSNGSGTKTRHRGLKQSLVGYMRERPDYPVTLDDLDEEYPNSRESISSTMSALCRDDTFPIVSRGQGLYQWDSRSEVVKDDGVPERGDLLEVISQPDEAGFLITQDDKGGKWVARRFDAQRAFAE